MSARDLIMSGRALSTVISGFSTDLGRASLRARWPGVTQVKTAPDKSLTLYTYGGTVVWNEILTLLVDPGTWLLVAEATIEYNGPDLHQWISRLRIDTGPGSEAQDAHLYIADAPHQSFLQVHEPVFSTTEFTVYVDAAHGTDTPGAGGLAADAVDISLIAYPL